ncbi:LacI family DNA-binding transcriptional regulator [Actinoplanes teichomyceticus]|uniref:LacI family transcriptional regulator n=1 Tax=Actinoplanes teichomyceticus TaxID=1867 RepID=A0A561WID0_ACTTI|nr:LacI family DNA-binding transcriptional regulator [Actinoplanes teichomyceticus]TWG23621.1 LacI family transcriptional regulator [Actinoplanes teichomyceticus]GIF11660.1 LacI family transcriptional regulator [Actinoplanes teichomyceticus]
MAATVSDVARAAGVSASTVSRALTGGTVSPATREMVMAVASQLGYQPNRAARGLITGRTGNLGLIVPDLRNPFFADVVKGVTTRARALDCGVFIADTDEDPRAELEAVAALSRNTDGLLLCSPRAGDDELLEVVEPASTVLIHRQVPGIPSVVADMVDGTRQAIAHLHALGHRRVAYVAGPEDSWASRQRQAALADAHADVEILRLGSVAPTFQGGVLAGDLVLASPATAVVAYNDMVALGLLHRLAARGISVPERLSVVGYDDVSLATMSHPPLTTVAVPKGRAGAAALDMVQRRIGGAGGRPRASQAAPEQEIVLGTSLVVRSSSGVAGA